MFQHVENVVDHEGGVEVQVDNVGGNGQASDTSGETYETDEPDVVEIGPEMALRNLLEDDLHSNFMVHIVVYAINTVYLKNIVGFHSSSDS